MISSEGEDENPKNEEKICSQVLGYRSEYIRGRGSGPKPNSSSSKQYYRAELEAANRRANELAEQLNSHQLKMNKMRDEFRTSPKATNDLVQAMMEQLHNEGLISPLSW
ncbi:unnamed protein product [Ilex paraguariensis]|uniref:Uncharacterized protein n=1 Tax=Ilex paraguariensis TaxID=185542 RepID=A0ABC8R3V0_9AQUA